MKEFTDNLPNLLDLYRPLIERSVRDAVSMSGKSCEEDDLRQEAIIALLSAAATYRAERDVTFGSYAKICIRNRLISYIRKSGRESSRKELFENELKKVVSPEERMIAEEDMLDCLRTVMSLLSEYEKRVFTLYLAGENNSAIARALGKSVRSVENALFRIRNKIQDIRPT